MLLPRACRAELLHCRTCLESKSAELENTDHGHLPDQLQHQPYFEQSNVRLIVCCVQNRPEDMIATFIDMGVVWTGCRLRAVYSTRKHSMPADRTILSIDGNPFGYPYP